MLEFGNEPYVEYGYIGDSGEKGLVVVLGDVSENAYVALYEGKEYGGSLDEENYTDFYFYESDSFADHEMSQEKKNTLYTETVVKYLAAGLDSWFYDTSAVDYPDCMKSGATRDDMVECFEKDLRGTETRKGLLEFFKKWVKDDISDLEPRQEMPEMIQRGTTLIEQMEKFDDFADRAERSINAEPER